MRTDIFSKIALVAFVLLFLIAPPRLYCQEPDSISVRFTDLNQVPLKDVEAFWIHDGKAKSVSVVNGVGRIQSANGLIVAKSDGYQYSGVLLNDTKGRGPNVVLRQAQEPSREYHTRMNPLPDSHKKRLTDEIADYFWTRLEENSNDPTTLKHCLDVLARLSPKKCATFIEESGLSPQLELLARQLLLTSLIESDLDAAIEMIDAIEDPMYRASVLTNTVPKVARDDPRQAAMEAKMIESVKAVKTTGISSGRVGRNGRPLFTVRKIRIRRQNSQAKYRGSQKIAFWRLVGISTQLVRRVDGRRRSRIGGRVD